MKFNFIKSFDILVKNPQIMLLLVIYLLFVVSLLPALVYSSGKIAGYIIYALLFLLTAAFLSGWLGMIKTLIKCKETNDAEIDFKNRYNAFRKDFFASIPVYILPLIFYMILFALVQNGILYFANAMTGGFNEIKAQMAMLNDQSAITNFMNTLTPGDMAAIVKFSTIIYASTFIYILFTVYSFPALFYMKGNNPLVGLKNGITAVIKKPLYSILLLILILLFHMLIHLFSIFALSNPILSFIALVLRVCFVAYIIVLLFTVYEQNFTDNSNNGADCFGENNSCN